jgi:NADH dehydrogenase
MAGDSQRRFASPFEIAADRIVLSSGETVPTRTVVWTAGVRAHPSVERLGLTLDGSGRVMVDEYLQALDHDRVWAIGDAAAVRDPGREWQHPCPPTAQHALLRREGRIPRRHDLSGHPDRAE